MRLCPVCLYKERTEIFSMSYQYPDNWPLPSRIEWYTCNNCGMLYGDGDFNQDLLDDYYRRFYGYGINSPANTTRLRMDAVQIESIVRLSRDVRIVDFGGAGDDGKSIIVDVLHDRGYRNVVSIGPGDKLPDDCKVIYASHVIEHIYDLPKIMKTITDALSPDGTLIIDVPNSTGLLRKWEMPILDFNTKHLNHFTLRDLLALGFHHGLEMTNVREYELEGAPAFQAHFEMFDMALMSAFHIKDHIGSRIEKLKTIKQPVNVWGLGDITWHLLSLIDLDVLDYIDNDPAMRGETYKGKQILEAPTNDAPIVILAQGQRGRLIENIRQKGITNLIMEI